MPRILVGLVLASVLLGDVPALAGLRAACKAQCATRITTLECALLTGRAYRRCRKSVLRRCRQQGLSVCAVPITTTTTLPPSDPACGPQCPAGGTAVWTGIATSDFGGYVRVIASLCLDASGVQVRGSWACESGSLTCPVGGGVLFGPLLGANLSLVSEDATRQWRCYFNGVRSGLQIAGSYSCAPCIGVGLCSDPFDTGTFVLDRCP